MNEHHEPLLCKMVHGLAWLGGGTRVRQLLAAVGTDPRACRHALGAAWEGGISFRRRIKRTLQDRCKIAARWAGLRGRSWLGLQLAYRTRRFGGGCRGAWRGCRRAGAAPGALQQTKSRPTSGAASRVVKTGGEENLDETSTSTVVCLDPCSLRPVFSGRFHSEIHTMYNQDSYMYAARGK